MISAPSHRATPLLRWGDALLKLELLGASGTTAARAAAEWKFGEAGVIEARGPAAIAAAEAARRSGARLTVRPRGVFTHEMRETLRLWGVAIDAAAQTTLPALDSDAAVHVFARTLGAELSEELATAPALVVAPAGDRAALLGAVQALRKWWPRVRAVALLAADEELPDLPREIALPDFVERVQVSRAKASQARGRVARELGLLASHASAAAALHALEQGGVALVTAAGEREFSLETAQ